MVKSYREWDSENRWLNRILKKHNAKSVKKGAQPKMKQLSKMSGYTDFTNYFECNGLYLREKYFKITVEEIDKHRIVETKRLQNEGSELLQRARLTEDVIARQEWGRIVLETISK